MEHGIMDTITLAVVLGVTCYTLARRLRLPAILFYLLAGALFGPMGFHYLHVDSMGTGLSALVEIAVAIILFEGGLSLSTSGFRKTPTTIGRIIFIALPLTAIGGTFLGYKVLGLSLEVSIIFGVIMVVTGPTVIAPLLQSVNLQHRLEVLLHWESIWGDVIGVLLGALVLQFVALKNLFDVENLATTFLGTMLAGASVGIASGFLLNRFLLPWATGLKIRGLVGTIAFAAVMAVFLEANSLKMASGPLAAAMMGFYLSYEKGPHLQAVKEFKEQLAVLFISTLFVLLSASVNPLDVAGRWPSILLTGVALAFIVRPIAVNLALLGSEMNLKERLYVGLMGPRGIVAMAAASLVALTLPDRSEDTALLATATYFCIFFSGTFATLCAKPLAKLLGVKSSLARSGIVFVGANELSTAMAEVAGPRVPVIFLDTSKDKCTFLNQENYSSVCTDALNDDVYEQALSEGFRRLVACTHHDALNQLICKRASHFLGDENVYAVSGAESEEVITTEPLFPVRAAFTERMPLTKILTDIRKKRAVFETLPASTIKETRAYEQGRVIALLNFKEDGGVCLIEAARPLPETGELFCLVRNEESVATGIIY
ncbi:cation:proton antiporter [Desulfovibrio inopinatus]|uniref:cation:proton antiporter n=1 Tax=Desulfovibrio inopinatus TaxID=102109 RepID=UPI00040EADD4|nr:sodium:proton antiporter [Desulfovibrio inopinatus]